LEKLEFYYITTNIGSRKQLSEYNHLQGEERQKHYKQFLKLLIILVCVAQQLPLITRYPTLHFQLPKQIVSTATRRNKVTLNIKKIKNLL
jgi:hypothetical protein